MGIPSYFSYIIKNHSNIIRNAYYHKNVKKTVFHSLYMDCNSLIYDAIRSIENWDSDPQDQIIDQVIRKIKHHIYSIAPTNIVYIAFDGVAPFAKMNQQRIRRHKTGYMEAIDFANSCKKAPTANKWNTSAITPGTEFMELLSAKVEYAFLQKPYGVKTLVVSGSNFAGEGEHKMFQYMRDHANQKENIAVYGLDSDLIMLSLFHCFACENIYIFREAPEFSKNVLPKGMKVLPNEPLFLDSRNLADSMLKEMGVSFGSAEENRFRIYDYIFMCFFLGNDFLPHFPALNIRTHGIYTLLELYKTTMAGKRGVFFIHPETAKIQWKVVKAFLQELAKGEHQAILTEHAARDKMGKRAFPDKTPEERAILFENIPILYRAEETYICPEERGWQDRYYEMAFHTADKRKICLNYLEGLEWVFRYYTEGCPHWRWKYDYHYPPLFQDLVQYVPDFDTEFIDSTRGTNRPFHANVQLSYVIPPWNRALLPEAAKRMVEKTPDYFVDLDQLEFQWMFCRYFWESHALLRDIPLSVMEEWDSKYIR